MCTMEDREGTIAEINKKLSKKKGRVIKRMVTCFTIAEFELLLEV